MRLHAGQFNCQRARRELLIDRVRSEFEHRSNGEHNRNQRDKAQHAQAEPTGQRQRDGGTEHECHCQGDEHWTPAGHSVLRHQISNQHRGHNGSGRNQRVQDSHPLRSGSLLLETASQVIGQQNGACGNRGKNVARKLRLREGKEHNGNDQPAAGKHAELQFQIRLVGDCLALGPPGAG